MDPVIFRPHAKLQTKFFLIMGCIGLVALLGVFVFTWGITESEGGGDAVGLGLLVTIGGNAIWLLPALLVIPAYCRSLVYEIHPDEVIVRVGVVTRSVKHVPYRTVTNLQVMQGPFDRFFGLGTLNIQTAGMSGQQGAEESLIGLPNFQQVYEMVAESLRRFRGAMGPDAASQDASPALPAVVEQAVVPAPPALPAPVVEIDLTEVLTLMQTILAEVRVIRQNVEL